MKKIFKNIFIVLVFFLVFTVRVDAEIKGGTLKELRQNLQGLKNKANAQDQKTAKTKNEISVAKSNIFSSQEEIKKNEKIISDAKIEIAKLNIEIAQLQEELKNQLNFEQATKGENIYLEFIFNSESYADLVYRYAIAEQIASHRNEKINNWNEKIDYNTQLQKELAEREIELAKKIAQLEKEVVYLGKAYDNDSDVLMSIKDEIKSTQEYINYLVEIGCGENESISTCLNVNGDIYFRKPMTKGTITSYFGYRTHPTTGEKYSYHNAIDIGGSQEGTNIYSSANGVVAKVITASMSDPKCGGRQVYVYHNIAGKLYTTAYYHLLAIKVKVGDVVTSNTVVGTLGGGKSTPWDYDAYGRPCSTGPHLHFVVAEGWYGSDCSGDCYYSWNTFKYVKSVDPKPLLKLPNKGIFWYSR